jgi:16S rRNA (guanine966-N2)-methyltransferase
MLPGARVLDLFAGSGALGLEALSRGAARVTFVERSGGALRALRENIRRLDAEAECDIVRADALGYVAALGLDQFDLALADPPYGEGAAVALARLFMENHFARWLWVEHRVTEALPEMAGARTRRYGDTALTSIPASG